MTSAERRRYAPVFRWVRDHNPDGLGPVAALALREKPTTAAPRSLRPAARRKAEKRLTTKERTAEVRAMVFSRAEGKCEAWHPHGGDMLRRCLAVATVLDHWQGGIGRRRQRESVMTCWALCPTCNERRTANWPSADYWNTAWQAHTTKHDYPFKPHITRPRS